jgi:hypothetical protein
VPKWYSRDFTKSSKKYTALAHSLRHLEDVLQTEPHLRKEW